MRHPQDTSTLRLSPADSLLTQRRCRLPEHVDRNLVGAEGHAQQDEEEHNAQPDHCGDSLHVSPSRAYRSADRLTVSQARCQRPAMHRWAKGEYDQSRAHSD